MRPLSYRSDELRALLLRNQMATLDELRHGGVEVQTRNDLPHDKLLACVGMRVVDRSVAPVDPDVAGDPSRRTG